MARVAAPLDVRHERGQLGIVVAEDVLDEERASRPQDAGDLPERGQELGEMVGGDPARDGAEGGIPEWQRVRVGRQRSGSPSHPGRGELARGPQHRLA